MGDLISHLLGDRRQLRTNAHPLVEITVMRRPKHNRTLVHFINLSGHSQTAYFDPLEMHDIEVELSDDFLETRSVQLDQELRVGRTGGRGKFTLPRVKQYDVVVLE